MPIKHKYKSGFSLLYAGLSTVRIKYSVSKLFNEGSGIDNDEIKL